MSEKVIQAMKMIVHWRNMKDLCDARSDCNGCPYSSNKVCDSASTINVMNMASNVFREHLLEVGHET